MEIGDPADRDIVEHQGDEGLAGGELRFEDGRDQRPEAAADDGGDHHRREQRRCGKMPKVQGDPRRAERAHVELAFRADVPEFHLERDRNPERKHHERDGFVDGLGEAVFGV